MGKLPAEHNPYQANEGYNRATFTVGAESTDTVTVNVALKDANGNAIVEPVSGRLYISDDSAGLDPCATAASGGIVVGTNGAITPIEHGSSGVGKQALFTSEANGTLDVKVVHSGAKTCYLVLVKPDGKLLVSTVLTFA